MGRAVLVISAVAIATAAVQTSAATEVPAKSIRTASATCKPGDTALAGGFEAPDFGRGRDSTAARLNLKKLKDRVRARAYNFGEDPGQLVAYAYCEKGARAPVTRAARAAVAPGKVKSLFAVCPRGMKVLSGGFATGAFDQRSGPRVLTLTSRRAGPRRWKVQAFNLTEGDPASSNRAGKLAAYAYCVKRDAPIRMASKRVTVPPMPAERVGRPRSFRVSCPGNGRAVAGGFDGNISLAGEGRATAAVTSMRTRDRKGWRTSAISLPDATSSTITAYVYCSP